MKRTQSLSVCAVTELEEAKIETLIVKYLFFVLFLSWKAIRIYRNIWLLIPVFVTSIFSTLQGVYIFRTYSMSHNYDAFWCADIFEA